MMQVGIVNDLGLALEMLKRVVGATPGFAIAWLARDGEQAVEKHSARPADIVLMDLIMPGMDGVETTGALMAVHACAILVVTATVAGSREMVFAAMNKGALDAVNTPNLSSTEGADELRRKLVTISRLVKQTAEPGPRVIAGKAAVNPVPGSLDRDRTTPGDDLAIIGIGASTGGPQAVATILGGLPPEINAAIVLVQHLDRQFVPGLERWLLRACRLPMRMAQQDDRLCRGAVWLAHTNDHLVLASSGGGGVRLGYAEQPRDVAHRPSINTFFSSLARLANPTRIGVLLTGMGRDGAAGLLEMKRSGAHTIAQDQASSVVYGMPRAALEMGAVVAPTPLDSIAERLIEFAGVVAGPVAAGSLRRER